jgi:hypothetical protein
MDASGGKRKFVILYQFLYYDEILDESLQHVWLLKKLTELQFIPGIFFFLR